MMCSDAKFWACHSKCLQNVYDFGGHYEWQPVQNVNQDHHYLEILWNEYISLFSQLCFCTSADGIALWSTVISSGTMIANPGSHGDVIKWKFFPGYWPFVRGIHRSPMDSPHKGQWHGALMFYLICAWTNGWAYNRDTGDLSRYHSHYDVTAMWIWIQDRLLKRYQAQATDLSNYCLARVSHSERKRFRFDYLFVFLKNCDLAINKIFLNPDALKRCLIFYCLLD